MSVKIAVIEPSFIIRTGIMSILKHSARADVFEINEMEELGDLLLRQNPDILVVNPSLIGVSILQIKKEMPEMKCIALLLSMVDNNLMSVYDEAISVYDTAKQIKDKIQRITFSFQGAEERNTVLSSREKEVIRCVVKGLTTKQIAKTLCLSAHTIITHRRNISTKLQIHNTAGLAIYAIVNKLVTPEELE
ncbi:MAG: response regulator transcription factor [Bacteroidales bacterium]|jgi:DNA-binding NarL/FixJ family response regulator|nr:response regulator transcription factor [Bacteroidales bacterium]